MIGMLSGTCLLSGSGEAIIDVGGVGYLVQAGRRALSDLREGQPARLHIETHVREQAITLYGFGSEEERAWFVRLQSVQGVGPKAALAMLDIMTPAQVLSAASLEDKTAFARASGVGPKLAARIATELSGKPPPSGRGYLSGLGQPESGSASSPAAVAGHDSAKADMQMRNDAVSALANLGIGQSDALRAVAATLAGLEQAPALDDLIKGALKELSA